MTLESYLNMFKYFSERVHHFIFAASTQLGDDSFNCRMNPRQVAPKAGRGPRTGLGRWLRSLRSAATPVTPSATDPSPATRAIAAMIAATALECGPRSTPATPTSSPISTGSNSSPSPTPTPIERNLARIHPPVVRNLAKLRRQGRRREEAHRSGPFFDQYWPGTSNSKSCREADEQIRTGDPDLGSVPANVRLVLMRPAESAASGSNIAPSGSVCPVSRSLYYLGASLPWATQSQRVRTLRLWL